MSEEDLKFYNSQDKEELVIMCIARENKIKYLQQENKQLKAKIDKAKHYIYFHSTQRKMFANFSDRFHNQKIQFKGRIEDLLEILGDKENESN